MCTVLLLLRPDAPWPLLAGANRDERFDRAFDPPGRYWPGGDILGGRDTAGGGSWFAVNDAGVMATIVNGMDRLGPLAGKASRGELVLRALRGGDARAGANAIAALAPERYRGFTLLVADRRAAFAVTSDERAIRIDELAPGFHMITPDGVDNPESARYAAHIAAFRAARPPDPARGDWSSWTELLRHADDEDPQRAMTVVISERDFGTVCSQLLALPASREAVPQLFFANGPPTRAVYERVAAGPRVRRTGVEPEGSECTSRA